MVARLDGVRLSPPLRSAPRGRSAFYMGMNVLTRGRVSAILVTSQRGVSPARCRIWRFGESALAVYVGVA